MSGEATCDESGAGRALGWRGLRRQGQQRVRYKLLNADGFSIPGGIGTGRVDHDVASLRLPGMKAHSGVRRPTTALFSLSINSDTETLHIYAHSATARKIVTKSTMASTKATPPNANAAITRAASSPAWR